MIEKERNKGYKYNSSPKSPQILESGSRDFWMHLTQGNPLANVPVQNESRP